MAHARAKLLNDKKGSYESVNTNIQGSPVLSISQKKEEFAWRSSPQGDTQFPVVHYEEQLYLNQALVIGAKTIWKFVVQETKSSKAQHIHVGVSKNNTASQNILQSVSIDILHCQSYEECKTLQDQQLIPTDLPSWSAYKISSDLEEHSDTAYYVVVLQKPENYGASMEPTQFYFKGTYENPQESWELESSLAIVLADYSPKSFETAFGILAFTNFDYSPNVYFQPNAKVHWKHFLSFIDSHCAGATNNERKISDRVNLLSPLHLDSIMRLTQCDDNKVTMKRVRYFCNESQAGGVVPPLIQIEKTIQRYPKCWEKGLIVGVISSTVAKQYLLGQGHSVGSFILRMQYNSPAEVCASSVQIHPQSGATFVDHFTIPKNVAVDDWSLMEYLAHSSIHQVLLPIQQLCAPSMLHSEPSPTSSNNVSSYRTTDQQLQRTTDLLHTIHEQPSPATTEPISFNVSLQENPDNSFAALSHTDSSVLMKSENSSTLDPKVYKWLVDLFGEDSSVLQEVVKPFEEERVTFSSLEVLDGSDLKEMGIPVGPRKQLLQALQDTFL